MTTNRLTRLALLTALCVALRHAFAAFPNVKPITAIFLVIAASLGLLDSLLVMTLTMTVTAFILGFGPWVLWQVLAYAVIVLVWKVMAFPLTNRLKSATIRTIVQSVLAGLMGLVYGLVIDSLSAVFYQMPIWAYLLNGMVFNVAHVVSTTFFYPIVTTSFARLEPLFRKGDTP